MKYIFHLLLVLYTFTSFAQPVYIENHGFDLESIADIDIGWMEIKKYPSAPKGIQAGDRSYSAKQIGYSQQFVEWMQQSYLPRGCLGNAIIYQNEIPKFNGNLGLYVNERNKQKNALPHLYGAETKISMFLKKNAAGKFVPLTNHGNYWDIEANGLQYIGDPVSFISSSDEYYFLLTDYKNHPKGYNADDKSRSNLLGFDTHKNISKYKHFFLPGYTIGTQYVVIMTKNNEELPFEKITIGEFFTRAEKQFPVWQKVESLSAENYATAQKNLNRLKEKYKNKWNDIAEMQISKIQITLTTFVNAREGDFDMFDNMDINGKVGVNTVFPILKVSKKSKELCKTDQPQWLVIRWTWDMQNSAYFIHFHESILNNFNFEYVYNYFFDPEKVKDQPYKPLRSPAFRESVVATEASASSKKNSTDKNVYFFEDFSGTAINKTPSNWNSNLVNGEKAVIAETVEASGKWIVVKGHYIKYSNFKTPFPANFEISYDIAVPKDFTWGGKRLDMVLSKENTTASSFRFSISPGSNGANGNIEVENNFGNGYESRTKYYKAPGFSNDKILNKAKVVITKKGESMQIFVNNSLIVDLPKVMPANEEFQQLQFKHIGSSDITEKYYISNIKIIKN